MSQPPVAGPQTAGRVLGADWTIANVARLLRANAQRGAWQSSGAVSGSRAEANQYYLRKVSAKHLPTGVSLLFMQLKEQNCWYASLCFAGDAGYLPWNAEIAEEWLGALFGEDRQRVMGEDEQNSSVRQFTLYARSRGEGL